MTIVNKKNDNYLKSFCIRFLLKGFYPNYLQLRGFSLKKSDVRGEEKLEMRGIDPRTSRMLSERSTI